MTGTRLSAATLVLLASCHGSLLLHMCTTPEDELRVQLASPHETLPNPRFTVFDPNNSLYPRYDNVMVNDVTDYLEHYPTVWDTYCQRESCAGGDAVVFSYGEKFAGFTELIAPQPLQIGREYVLYVSRRERPRANGVLAFGVEAGGSLRQYRVEADGSWHPIQVHEKVKSAVEQRVEADRPR